MASDLFKNNPPTAADRRLARLREALEYAVSGLTRYLDAPAVTVLAVVGQTLRPLGEGGFSSADPSADLFSKNQAWIDRLLDCRTPVAVPVSETLPARRRDVDHVVLFPVTHRNQPCAILMLETTRSETPPDWTRHFSVTEAFWGSLTTELTAELEKLELIETTARRESELESAHREIEALHAELTETRRAQERILARIGYELRAPLTSLLGFCEILHDETYGPLSSSQLNFLDAMQSGGKRMLDIVNLLVDFAQLERNVEAFAFTEFRVKSLLKTLEADFAPVAAKRNIVFQVRWDADRLALVGDEEKLKQAIHQLLDNAFKFTPSGGRVELTASSVYGVGGEQGCEISVRDSGQGIAPEDRHRVFQPFPHSDADDMRSPAGLGLGLAVAQRILGLHGARLALESKVGEGSRFFFTLPRQGPAKTRRVPLVMVVEDDPETLELLKMILTGNGFEPLPMPTAELALENLTQVLGSGDSRNLPDVMLLDIMLPHMDGFEFCRQVKAFEGLRHIPIIMLSVLQTSNVKLRALESGAADFLTKPVNRKELLARIKSLVARKREYENILREYTRAHKMAVTDGLTGLFNHSHLIAELDAQVQASRAAGRPLSVIMLDVDWFKHFNDTNGHLAGNEVLKTLAALMEQNFRQGDLSARYGGEEFAVVLPNTTKEQAVLLAERLRKRVEEHPFTARETQPHGKVTISLGVAAFPTDAESGSEVLEYADRALYRAKQEGRNLVRVWETGME